VALHRDISAVNVLVSMSKGASHPEFGLIDFGLATEIETWEKQMAHVCTVGNGHYWPVFFMVHLHVWWTEVART
jgi:hypothetical protein